MGPDGREASVTRPSGRSRPPFADRLAALVLERRSQICLGLDPDPAALGPAAGDAEGEPRDRAAEAVIDHCVRLIDLAGPACVAVKPQLACFERLGPPGWAALESVVARASAAGLLVIADGKRGDVPHTAATYAQALLGGTSSPWGDIAGLGADAITVNPLLGADSVQPFFDAAAEAGAAVFVLVRTSNPGAADFQDRPTGRPLHERLAEMVGAAAKQLRGESGLSGAGAVVGATEPQHIARLRELMPNAILLVPGVGAQGGDPADLAPAFTTHPAGAVVAAARSIAGAPDPARAAESLRAAVWESSGGG